MTTVEKLKAAKELIIKGWTRGSFARRKNGKTIDPYHEDAVRFDAIGACKRVAPAAYTDAVFALIRALPTKTLVEVTNVNDNAASKHEVLSLFDKAIENCNA
jgi:hypothetical protein